MGTWRDELLGASFRGVGFKVKATEVSVERRHVVHEFPLTDGGTPEDLGRRPREFTVDAYVLGANYQAAKRALIDATVMVGTPATLTTPWWAPRTCYCSKARIRESAEEGGLAVFELEFIEVSDKEEGVTFAPKQKAKAAAQTVRQTTETGATQNLELVAQPDGVREGAAEEVRKIGLAISKLDWTHGPTSTVAELAVNTRRMIEDASALSTSPADLVAIVRTSVEDVLAAASNARAALASYDILLELQAGELGGGTIDGQARDRNARLVIALARETAIALSTSAAVDIAWESRQEAEAARARLYAHLDALEESAEDESYSALVALRSAIAGAVPDPDEDLPDIVTIIPAGETNTLAIAYRLYDDPTRDDEIRARNNLPNAARVPGLAELEVLSR